MMASITTSPYIDTIDSYSITRHIYSTPYHDLNPDKVGFY